MTISNFDPILKLVSPIAASLATWLVARYARRVVVQISDHEVRIETATVNDAQRMLKAVEQFQCQIHQTNVFTNDV